MTRTSIEQGGLGDPEVVALLAEHARELRSVSPEESAHVLDLSGLLVPEVSFWTARVDGEVAGCVALKDLGAGHLELKSMRVVRRSQRGGVGRAMLEHVLAHAREVGAGRVSLETGSQDFFAPARALYATAGFEECEAFGDYRPDPHSTFMTLSWVPPSSP